LDNSKELSGESHTLAFCKSIQDEPGTIAMLHLAKSDLTFILQAGSLESDAELTLFLYLFTQLLLNVVADLSSPF